MLTWGATPQEAACTYPGDELVQDPDGGATMATMLPAPPERVWSWLVQMGGGRAGWYSWDWVDNNGQPSAGRIVPEWQGLEEGQHLYRAPKGENWFTVVVLEPNRTLVLHSAYGMFSGRSFDPRSGPAPWAYIDGIWGFHLRAAPGGGTRLVVRSRSWSRPRPVARPFGLLVGEPLHFVMQTRQFHNLRTRIGAEV
jgi:proline iminopeptidase